jgi:anti-sigma factor RsiW
VSALSRLPSRDLERLSAYVDGALAPREQAALDARLAHEPDLRQGLDELRSLKAAMASLPERRVPRDFTLRDAHVARRTAGTLFPALRFATALASVLFVLTTAVRLLPFPATLGASAPQAEVAAEFQAEPEATPASLEAGAELRAEAPAAAPGEMADSASAAMTATPAGTPCPECPAALTEEKNEVAQVTGEMGNLVASQPTAIPPIAAAQVFLGVSAIVLGVLTMRARRR